MALTDYQGKQYDPAALFALQQQILPRLDPSMIGGSAWGQAGQSIGFDYAPANALFQQQFGRPMTIADQIALDMARQLYSRGVSDIGQLSTQDRFDQVPIELIVPNGGPEFGYRAGNHVLTPEEVQKYVTEAPNPDNLTMPSAVASGKMVTGLTPLSDGFAPANWGGAPGAQYLGGTYTGEGGTQYNVHAAPDGTIQFGTFGSTSSDFTPEDLMGVLSVLAIAGAGQAGMFGNGGTAGASAGSSAGTSGAGAASSGSTAAMGAGAGAGEISATGAGLTGAGGGQLGIGTIGSSGVAGGTGFGIGGVGSTIAPGVTAGTFGAGALGLDAALAGLSEAAGAGGLGSVGFGSIPDRGFLEIGQVNGSTIPSFATTPEGAALAGGAGLGAVEGFAGATGPLAGITAPLTYGGQAIPGTGMDFGATPAVTPNSNSSPVTDKLTDKLTEAAVTAGLGALAGGGGGGSVTDPGTAAEDARQKRIDDAIRAINEKFGYGDTDAARSNKKLREVMYGDISGAVHDAAMRDIDRQYTHASRQNVYGLARSGLLGGSADAEAGGELSTLYGEGQLKSTQAGQQAASDLRTNDEKSRQNLITIAQGGLDVGTAGSLAAGSLQSAGDLARKQAEGATVGRLFDDLSQAYVTNRVLNARYPNGLPQPGQTAGYSSNVFAPSKYAGKYGASPFGSR